MTSFSHFRTKKTFHVFCYCVFQQVEPCHNVENLEFFYARAITLQLKNVLAVGKSLISILNLI